MATTTCDWCGKIDTRRYTVKHKEFGRIEVCYDCFVDFYNQIFPPMKSKSFDLMVSNMHYLNMGMDDKIYLGYIKA
jgi:hypothetical protein